MEQNVLIVISMVLAILPVVSYLLQEVLCGLENKKRLFSKCVAVTYLDWVFVPFNVLWIFTVSLNYWIVLIFLVVLAGNLVFMKLWENVHTKEKNPFDFYDIKKKKITDAGIVHLIYAQIQATLIFSFLFFSGNNILTYIGLLFLLIYLGGMPVVSRVVHGKFIKEDAVLFGIGVVLFLIKLFLMLS